MNIITSATFMYYTGIDLGEEYYDYSFNNYISMSDDINSIVSTAQTFNKEITLEELYPLIRKKIVEKITKVNQNPNFKYYIAIDSMKIFTYNKGDIYNKIDGEILSKFGYTFAELEKSKTFNNKGTAKILLLEMILFPKGKPFYIIFPDNYFDDEDDY